MHAAVRDEAEQVHPLTALERRHERRVGEERPVRDRAVDPHQVLEEHATGSDRQVADLRVPHLPGRQADGFPGGVERRGRKRTPETVEVRGPRELDGVSGAGRRAAPAVEDDERYERMLARQIAVKESTPSDAPPTSAPSTAGCASSSAALSGLTEPPQRTGTSSNDLMNP